MTINDFMLRFNLKKENTIIDWINKGYIPGSTIDEKTKTIFIPEASRPPYTEHRAKNSTAIYKSIVKACIARKGVCANLYKISELEFQTYINDLLQSGYIRSEVQDGITYYFATTKSNDFLKSSSPKKLLVSCVGVVAESIAKGTTTAILEKAMA